MILGYQTKQRLDRKVIAVDSFPDDGDSLDKIAFGHLRDNYQP